MASRAAGKTSRVYGSYTKLMCELMISTWGYLFKANKKENIKIHVNPAKFTSPLGGLCNNIFMTITNSFFSIFLCPPSPSLVAGAVKQELRNAITISSKSGPAGYSSI